MDELPLFVLGTVALPFEAVPLHVFEPRYRAMIEHCLAAGSEFGIVLADDDGERGTACACAIEEVLRRHDDGRLDILARGTRPVRVVERHDDREWPAAVCEPLSDDAEQPDTDAVLLARQAYETLVRDATDEEPDPAQLEAMGAYAMAATVELPVAAKQELLELRSENARLRRVATLVRDAMRRVEVVEEAAESARTNGRIHHD